MSAPARLEARAPSLSKTLQFTVQSDTVEMSLTRIRLPEKAGAGHVALSATVYVFSGSNPPGVLLATINSALSLRTSSRSPACTTAAFVPCRGCDVHSVLPVFASAQKNCPLFIADIENSASPTRTALLNESDSCGFSQARS